MLTTDIKFQVVGSMIILLNLCDLSLSYKKFNVSALTTIIFTNIDAPPENVHSEYYFGYCATRRKLLMHNKTIPSELLVGKMMVTGWMFSKLDPKCIYIRATSAYADLLRYDAMKFSICLSTIVYNYWGDIFRYHYYEWFLPLEMKPGVTWDIFMYVDGLPK